MVGQLAKVGNWSDSLIIDVLHQQSFPPKIFVQVEFLKLRVIYYKEVEDVLSIFLKDCLCFDSESVFNVKIRHVSIRPTRSSLALVEVHFLQVNIGHKLLGKVVTLLSVEPKQVPNS